MKLIIDIPDKDYEFIKDLNLVVIGGRGNTKTVQYNVINAIKKGIPSDAFIKDISALIKDISKERAK